MDALIRLRRDAEAERDELRAILEPLLDEPIDSYTDAFGDEHCSCRFCGATVTNPRLHKRLTHNADCPVLRRDALLGRV